MYVMAPAKSSSVDYRARERKAIGEVRYSQFQILTLSPASLDKLF